MSVDVIISIVAGAGLGVVLGLLASRAVAFVFEHSFFGDDDADPDWETGEDR